MSEVIIGGLRVIALAGFALLAVLYHVLTGGGWRKQETGRWIMTLALTPLILLTLAVLIQCLGRDWPGFEIVRGVAYIMIGVIPYWIISLLIRAQRRRRARERTRS